MNCLGVLVSHIENDLLHYPYSHMQPGHYRMLSHIQSIPQACETLYPKSNFILNIEKW